MSKFSDNKEEILTMRVAGDIVRNHTTPALDRTDTVGKHCYNAANLLVQLFPDASKELLVYILRHDWAESETGDMPGPAKYIYPVLGRAIRDVEEQLEEKHHLPTLTDVETRIFKFIDFAEWYLWCHEEYARGNRTPRFVLSYTRTIDYMDVWMYVDDGMFIEQVRFLKEISHIITKDADK